MIRYINTKTVYGVETVDQLEQKDFANYKEFITELNRILKEYHLTGMNVYSSQRCANEWKK